MCSIQACEASLTLVGGTLVTSFLYYANNVVLAAKHIFTNSSLLQADTKWAWSNKCTKAFQGAKKKITLAQVLTHHDPTGPIKLAVDASPYGVGAVISHSMPNGTE